MKMSTQNQKSIIYINRENQTKCPKKSFPQNIRTRNALIISQIMEICKQNCSTKFSVKVLRPFIILKKYIITPKYVLYKYNLIFLVIFFILYYNAMA